MTTDLGVPNQQECLRHIYAELFVEYVIKNPLYTPGDDFAMCSAFRTKLQSYVQTRPFFATITA
eukprot:CAMPEP_0172919018 /NCGR_PEP_ID=MMETSP1075-20121228/201305_1 /TAXON_ID=2916 /ORGANISM="Ceratium fusus, Strain PA161109" /LENGTH=63 /DNA_ID=CAMNT_0013778775 /DNA_START=293 /DNA_END=484 /DNA_ORIENTATION=+